LPTSTESYTPLSSWAFNPDLPKHVFDISAANKLLDDAGWTLGDDGVRVKNGNRLEFDIATVSGNPQRAQILQLAQQDWKKIGVAARIKTMPAAVVFGDYYTQSQFDCMIGASTYGTGPDPDPTQRFSSKAIPVQGGSGTNFYQYKNPEVDRLLQVGQSSFDRSERKKAYQEIQAIVRDDLVILPICQSAPVEGTKAALKGFVTNPYVSANCWNVNEWHWES
jgi:peptide/nickel transport system substrate-binding protein